MDDKIIEGEHLIKSIHVTFVQDHINQLQPWDFIRGSSVEKSLNLDASIANTFPEGNLIFFDIWNNTVNIQGKYFPYISLSKSESVKFSLIESVICLFTDSSVQKYFSQSNQLIFTDWINEKKCFSLLNQLISTDVISENWLIYSKLFLAIWISQISLINSRFWLIEI